MTQEQRCPLHWYTLIYSHDAQIDGSWVGIYVCPITGCETWPSYGEPHHHANDDDDPQAEAVPVAA